MTEQLKMVLNAWFAPRATEFQQQAATRIHELDEFLREAVQEEPETGARLEDSLGRFSAGRIDTGKLAAMLGPTASARHPDEERLARMREDLETLRATVAAGFDPRPAHMSLASESQMIIGAFDAHMLTYAMVFRALRRSGIDIAARYEPRTHAEYFDAFDWRDLDEAEMRLCPPFVVSGDAVESMGLLDLLTRGRPIKFFAFSDQVYTEHDDHGRSTALRLHPDPALCALALQGIYIVRRSEGFVSGEVQRDEKSDSTIDSTTDTTLDGSIQRGLDSPRAAFVSLWSGGDPERSRRARDARAFANFVYDPDAGFGFSACLDLDANPDPHRAWTVSPDGTPLTFADFAAGEEDLREHFTLIDPEADGPEPVPLAEFLDRDVAGRANCRPYVTTGDGRRLAPSRAMIDRTTECARAWYLLQTFAGRGAAAGKVEATQTSPTEQPARPIPGEIPSKRENEILRRAVQRIVAGLLERG